MTMGCKDIWIRKSETKYIYIFTLWVLTLKTTSFDKTNHL